MTHAEESFVVTARKWRPMRFSEVAGQDHVAVTLRNAILSGRVHHAYLFTGPRGVGKTTSARLMAKALNCLNPDDKAEPCNECASCRDILDGRSIDVVEIDGASNNSVDDVRKLRENSRYPPAHGKYKLYIIDEVHMLSTSAFNALLKTLEEPPPHLIFIFATTEVHKVPATILSRCQRFDFRRMELDTIVERLRLIAHGENIEIDEESLMAIAKKADGSMRDSQSIFDQVVAFCGKNIHYADVTGALHLIDEDFFFTVTKAIREGDAAAMFGLVRQIVQKGYDITECLRGLLDHFRNILSVLATGNTSLIETSSLFLERYEKEAAHFTTPDVLRLMNIASATEQSLRYSPQPRVRFELALTQMATMEKAVEISALVEELRAVKAALATGQRPVQRPPAIQPQQQRPPMQPMAKEQTAEYTPVFEEKSPPQPAAAHSPAPASQGQSATPPTKEMIMLNWQDFLRRYQNKSLTVLLGQSVEPQFFNGEVLLHAKNSFLAGQLDAQKAPLSDALSKYFHAPVAVTVSSSGGAPFAQQPSQQQGFGEAPPPAAPPPTAPPKERLPVEQEIVDLFGKYGLREISG